MGSAGYSEKYTTLISAQSEWDQLDGHCLFQPPYRPLVNVELVILATHVVQNRNPPNYSRTRPKSEIRDSNADLKLKVRSS